MDLARVTDEGLEPRGEVDVQNHKLTLTLEKGEAVRIGPK